MHDVFISYSRIDKEFVHGLRVAIQHANREIWIDESGIPPTTEFWNEIKQGIEESNNFLFVISPNSLESIWCQRELEYALECGKRIVPLLYLGGKFDTENPIYSKLKDIHWFDLKKYNGFSEFIDDLINILETDFEYVKEHTRLLRRAQEWERNSRNDSQLLRGSDLLRAQQWLRNSSIKSPEPTEYHRNFIKKSLEEESRLARARKTRNRLIGTGAVVLISALLVSGLLYWQAQRTLWEARAGERLERTGQAALEKFQNGQQVEALLLSMNAARELQAIVSDNRPLAKFPAVRPYLALQKSLYGVSYRQLEHTGEVTAIAVSPSNELIATGSEDIVYLWDRSGKLLSQFKGKDSFIKSIAFSLNSQLIMSASGDGHVRVWNIGGTKIADFKTYQSSLEAASFSPDGKQILTAGRDDALDIYSLRLWSSDGRKISEINNDLIKEIKISEMFFDWKENTFVLGDFRGVVTVIKDGKVNFLKLTNDYLHSLAVSPGEQRIVTGSGNITEIWNFQGQRLSSIEGERGGRTILAVAFISSGQEVITAGWGNVPSVWTLDGKLVRKLEGHRSFITSLAVSPKGDFIVTGSSDGTARIWSKSNEEIVDLKDHEGDIFTDSIIFSRQGNRVITASGGENLYFWDKMGNQIARVKAHNRSHLGTLNIAISRDGQRVVSAGEDDKVYFWDANGNRIAQLAGGGVFKPIAFSPDGKWVVTASNEKFYVWDSLGESVLDGRCGTVISIDFSQDSRKVLLGGAGVICLLDLDSQNLTAPVKLFDDDGKPQPIFNMGGVISPDGKHIAARLNNGNVRLWNNNGDFIAEFKYQPAASSTILGVAFSADGKYLIAGGGNGVVKVWDMFGKLLLEIDAHQGQVDEASFSPDGQKLLTQQRIVTNNITSSQARIWDWSGRLINEYEDVASISSDWQYIASIQRSTVSLQKLYELDSLLKWGCRYLSTYWLNRETTVHYSNLKQYCATLPYSTDSTE